MEEFRLLGVGDIDAYYRVLHEGYQENRRYPLSFSAMDATKEEERLWLQGNPTYGHFLQGELVNALSLRMPWGPSPGPEPVPHIGQVVTHPSHKRRGHARRLLQWVEEHVLREQLRVPFVTLGTAESHPWLRQMYERMGFYAFASKQFPEKLHRTIFLRKDYPMP